MRGSIRVNSISDIENVLKTIKNAEPEVYPYGNGNGQSFVDSFGLPNGDMLGDMIGVLLNKDEPIVTNYYESEEYAALLKIARSWYTSKLIMPDIETTKDSAATLVKANKIYCYAMSLKPGIEGQESRQCGKEMVAKQVIDVSTESQNIARFMYGIPSYSQNAEKAMQFLNLMYTDKDIVNLLTYGIEGIHYARVTGSDNIIDYAPGVTDETSGYSLNSGFQFGNQFLSYIWNGDPATIWEETDAMNKSAQKSVALGFIFDATNVKTQYTNVTNVISQYKNSLENGVMDPDIYLPEFISKLKEAGIDEIVSEKQKQLDEWLAASK